MGIDREQLGCGVGRREMPREGERGKKNKRKMARDLNKNPRGLIWRWKGTIAKREKRVRVAASCRG